MELKKKSKEKTKMIKLEVATGKVNIINPEGWVLLGLFNGSVHLINTQSEYTEQEDSEFRHIIHTPEFIEEEEKSFNLEDFVAQAKEQGLHLVKIEENFYVCKEDILSVSNIAYFEDGIHNEHTVVVHKYKGRYLVENTPIEEFMKQLEG